MKIKQLFLITILFTFIQPSSSQMAINDDEIFNLMNQLFDFDKTETRTEKPKKNKIKVTTEQKEIINTVSKKNLNDFLQHLNTYYPRVFVIREKFLINMTPENIAQTFDKIINVIAYKPWVYVEELFKGITQQLTTNEYTQWKNDGFNIQEISKKFNNPNLEKILIENNGFEEFIADQLSFLHEFLHYSKVDLASQITFFDKTSRYSSYSSTSRTKTISTKTEETLQSFWLKNGIKTAQDFYELCFSYFSRLFIKSINQENLRLTNKYFDDLKKILINLKNSPQESKAHEFINKYKDLLAILKQKVYSTKFSFLKKHKEFSELLDYWDAKEE